MTPAVRSQKVAASRREDERIIGSWCPQCGPDVQVDEDGCCAGCGSDAIGAGSDLAIRNARQLKREQDAGWKLFEEARVAGLKAADISAAAWAVLATHEDIGCSCNGCGNLRKTLQRYETVKKGASL